MKVALVTSEFHPFRGGGIGTYCESITRALVSAGHEVHVITSVPGPTDVYGATIHRCNIPYSTPGVVPPNRFEGYELALSDVNYVASYFWAMEIEKISDLHNFDIIESQECLAPIFYYLYKRSLGLTRGYIPVVVHLHTPSHEIALWDKRPVERPDMHMLKFMEDFTISMADGVISPSAFLASCVSARLPAIQQRLVVIPYPSFEKTADFSDSIKKKPGKEIVYAGRLEHRKGIEVLVNALIVVMEKRPDLRVRFIGKSMYSHVWGMQYIDWIKSRLDGYPGRVIFDGVLDRNQLLSRMSMADCVVIPSIGENFPNVCMEAMLAGAVIIASDQGGMAEMMGGDDNGFLFQGSNVGSLGSMIEKVLDLPDTITSRIRESACKRIMQFCNIDTILTRRENHYRKIIEESSSHNNIQPLPAQLFCGRDSGPKVASKEVKTVTAVIIDDGNKTVEHALNSILCSSRLPDEVYVLSHRHKAAAGTGNNKNPFNLRLITVAQGNLALIKNSVLRDIKTDALFYLSSSEILGALFIEKALDILNLQPQVAYVQTWTRGVKHVANPVMPFFPYVLYNHCFVSPSGLLRTEAIIEAGGYKPSLNFHYLDWQMVLSLMKAGWISAVIDECLTESGTFDYSRREMIEFGAGNIMYEEIVNFNSSLFRKYEHELYVAAGSLLSMSGLFLSGRLSNFERKLLKIYRALRTVFENKLSKVPIMKKIIAR